jgi:AraC-like DNA-binding protein
MARTFAVLTELPPDTRLFLELVIRLAPTNPVARRLAAHARIRPSTLMSRFSRAGLPSLKTYVAAIRLLYAAQLFESEGLSVSDVAYRLECSSPQSFGRHLRAMLGITPGEFRRRFGFERSMDRFLELLVDPYVEQWRTFYPLDPGGAERTRDA